VCTETRHSGRALGFGLCQRRGTTTTRAHEEPHTQNNNAGMCFCQAANVFLSLVSHIDCVCWEVGGGGDFCFLPLNISGPVKVEGTPWCRLFCELQVARSLFFSQTMCDLFTSFTTHFQHFLSLSLPFFFVPRYERACDALPPIVSGSDTVNARKVTVKECVGMC